MQNKYICRGCGVEFRRPLVREIKRINNLTAMPCPICNLKDHFKLLKEVGSAIWRLRCDHCGYVQLLYNFCDNHKTDGPKVIKSTQCADVVKFNSYQMKLNNFLSVNYY